MSRFFRKDFRSKWFRDDFRSLRNFITCVNDHNKITVLLLWMTLKLQFVTITFNENTINTVGTRTKYEKKKLYFPFKTI